MRKLRRIVARESPAATPASRPTSFATSERLPLRRLRRQRPPPTTRPPSHRQRAWPGSLHRGGIPITGVDAVRETACRQQTSSISGRRRRRSGRGIAGQHHADAEEPWSRSLRARLSKCLLSGGTTKHRRVSVAAFFRRGALWLTTSNSLNCCRASALNFSKPMRRPRREGEP